MFMLGYIKGSRPYKFLCDSFLSPFSDLLNSRSNLKYIFCDPGSQWSIAPF